MYDAEHPDRLARMIALGVEASMPEHGHGLIQVPQVKALGEPIPKE